MPTIEEAVSARNWGRATARKCGRSARWPYVPVIDRDTNLAGTGRVHAQQIRGLAFATRDEAVQAAERHIDRLKADFEAKLRDPRYRALRLSVGLPENLS